MGASVGVTQRAVDELTANTRTEFVNTHRAFQEMGTNVSRTQTAVNDLGASMAQTQRVLAETNAGVADTRQAVLGLGGRDTCGRRTGRGRSAERQLPACCHLPRADHTGGTPWPDRLGHRRSQRWSAATP